MSGPAARTPTPAQDPPYPMGHNLGGKPTFQPPSGECVQKFCGVHLPPPRVVPTSQGQEERFGGVFPAPSHTPHPGFGLCAFFEVGEIRGTQFSQTPVI